VASSPALCRDTLSEQLCQSRLVVDFLPGCEASSWVTAAVLVNQGRSRWCLDEMATWTGRWVRLSAAKGDTGACNDGHLRWVTGIGHRGNEAS
jgi:hypothetical protein